mgnify:CR=1 FL=1
MKTAVRLGPIAHLRRAKFEVVAYGNQACEFGINPHSHTWLPYITPNGVRLAHENIDDSIINRAEKLRILNILPVR